MSAIRGIPTTYKGIRFRSRAEACWAVLMDELGWAWEYEPIDLDGYIPDFLVMLEPTMPIRIFPTMTILAEGECCP